MPSLAARLTTRGVAAMGASLSIVAALVAGPAIPAAAVGQNAPAHLAASYDGYGSVRLSWEQVVYSMDGYYTDGYEVSYTNGLGVTVDEKHLTEQLETDGATGFLLDLYDVGLTPTVVKVRGTFSPNGASEWAQVTVDVTLANLAALSASADTYDSGYLGQFTANSRAALTAAIAAARALVAAGIATPQAVAAANSALQDAGHSMINYTEFFALIDETGGWDVTGFTPGALTRYNSALAAGRQLLDSAQNDPSAAITQDQFDAARIAIIDAYYGATTAPEGLAALLAEAESFVAASASATDYSAFSLTTARAAIAAAHVALDDQLPAAGDLDQAVVRLQSAFDARLLRPSAYTLALSRYAASAGTDATAASKAAVASARAAALAADASPLGTTATLTDAAAQLDAAISSLVSVAGLRSATSSAAGLVPGSYTTTTWAYFSTARDAATALLTRTIDATAQITTAQLQSQVTALTEARASLAAPVMLPPSPDGLSVRPPGLYVQVLDGMINLSNFGGNLSFVAGQFGYVPSSMQPPVVVPKNPGLQFTLPPTFQSSPNTNPTGPSGNVDCIVRATVVDPFAPLAAGGLNDAGPKKTFCNARLVDGLVTSAAATSRAASVALDPSNPNYIVVPAFPATRPANGQFSATFALPLDAITGDVYLQYVYNGDYYEVNAAVLQSLAATGAPTALTPAATSVTALAQTGANADPLLATAALLLLAGAVLTVVRSRRRVIRS